MAGKLAIECRGVSVAYGGVQALRDATYLLASGKTGAIVGPNGSGKTTLINCLSGLARFSGLTRVAGVDVRGYTIRSLAKTYISRSFQQPRLPPFLTVAQALMFMTRRPVSWGIHQDFHSAADADQILSRFGLLAVAEERVSAIAYGDRKVLATAVALESGVPVVVLDEPFAGIDSARLDLVSTAIRERTRSGATILLIDHNVERVVALADEVAVMADGVVSTQCLTSDRIWPSR